MKATLVAILFCAAAHCARAGESSLTETYQPLNGLGSGEITIAPVTCYDWYSHSGMPTAIRLICVQNIPPTNAPQPVGNINLAFECGIKLSASESEPRHVVIVIDCTALQAPEGWDQLQVVGATLECLRLVMGTRLDAAGIEPLFKDTGQEAIRKLIDEFIKHPKDKPFPWEDRKARLTQM